MFQFRPNRSSLAEAMAEVVEFETAAELKEHVTSELESGLGLQRAPAVTVEPYGHDARNGWDTHIVTIEGYGVAGFTDRMPPQPKLEHAASVGRKP